MRVFDTYYFNIIEKASFKETRPYIEKMLEELGYSYKNIALTLYSIHDGEQKKAVQKMPALEKYAFFENRGGIPDYGLTSIFADWRKGNIYAKKEDWKDIFTLFSKIPYTYNFAFVKLFFEGINWFPDSRDDIAPDVNNNEEYIPTEHEPPYKSNRIMMQRFFDDGKKYNRIYVTIEVTAEGNPRISRETVGKLSPYLGEPLSVERKCVFPQDERDRLRKREEEHSEKILAMGMSALPPVNVSAFGNSDIKIPHVADKPTLNKAFKGTGFERKKTPSNWVSLYSCTDKHGYLYEAFIQKISYGNDFRFWFNISGYNFNVSNFPSFPDYNVDHEGESLEVLRKFAEFCVDVRENYSDNLVKDFGITPDWYNNF